MAKTKTLKKPEAFSTENMHPAKLKAGIKTKAHDPSKRLRDRTFIAQALTEALLDGDTEAFKEILKAHFDAVNNAKILKEIGLSPRTFYSALSAKGNPNLETIAKIMHALSAGSRAKTA